VLATVLTQADKIILSSLVPLTSFGYYALASAGASALYVFIGPIFNASFPRLVRDASVSEGELERTYHNSCQLLSFLVLPGAATLVVFAPEVMSAWIGDERTTAETTSLLRLLAAGTALNGLMNLPYALMLAANWTRLPLLLNLGAVLVLLPLIVYLTGRFGTIGGAAAWFVLNLGYVSIGVPLLHTRVLRESAARWYKEDVGGPLVGTIAMVALARSLLVGTDTRGGQLLEVSLALAAATIGAVIGSPVGRKWLLASGQRFGRRSSIP
jgi:O-antigen/teichoic acid export membrane protein